MVRVFPFGSTRKLPTSIVFFGSTLLTLYSISEIIARQAGQQRIEANMIAYN